MSHSVVERSYYIQGSGGYRDIIASVTRDSLSITRRLAKCLLQQNMWRAAAQSSVMSVYRLLGVLCALIIETFLTWLPMMDHDWRVQCWQSSESCPTQFLLQNSALTHFIQTDYPMPMPSCKMTQPRTYNSRVPLSELPNVITPNAGVRPATVIGPSHQSIPASPRPEPAACCQTSTFNCFQNFAIQIPFYIIIKPLQHS